MNPLKKLKLYFHSKLTVERAKINVAQAAIADQFRDGITVPNYVVEKIHELTRARELADELQELLEYVEDLDPEGDQI